MTNEPTTPSPDAATPEGGADTQADASKLAGGSAMVLVGGAGEQGLRMVLNWFLANALGPFTFGIYTFCVMVLTVVGVLAPMGTDTGIVYFGARHRIRRERAELKGKLLGGLVVSAIGGLLTALILWWGARAGWLWSSKSDTANALAFVAPAIPLTALLLYVVGAVRAMKDMRSTAISFQLAFPLVTLVGAFTAIVMGAGLYGALAAFMLATAVSLGLTTVYARRWYGKLLAERELKPAWGWGPMLRFSLPQGSAGALFRLASWTDILLIMTLSTADQVGLYRAGAQWAMLGQLPVVAITTMFNPQVAELWSNREVERLNRLLEIGTRWLVVLSAPLFVGLLVAPDLLFEIYKPEYAPAAGIMVIIVLGQAVHVICTPAARLIPMTGHSGVHFLLALAALSLNVGLAWVMIPRWGGQGAAIAAAIAFTLWAIARLIAAWLLTRCFPFSRRSFMLLGGSAIIAVLGIGAGRTGLPGGQALPLVGAMLAYAGLVWMVGGTPEDAAVLQQVRGRVLRMMGRAG
jgi:O-antigen/teichoic acid export membrane protein